MKEEEEEEYLFRQ